MIGTVKLSWHCVGPGHNTILDTIQDMQIELKRFFIYSLLALSVSEAYFSGNRLPDND